MSDPFLWFIFVLVSWHSLKLVVFSLDRFGIDSVMFVTLVVFIWFVGFIKL